MAEVIPADLYQSIESIGRDSTDRWWGATIFLSRDCFTPFELDLSRARALSADSIIDLLNEDRKEYAYSLDRELSWAETVELDPVVWRDRVCDVLEAFWPCFAPTWVVLQAAFSQEAARVQRLLLCGQSIHEVLPELAPHYAWDSVEQEIVIATTMDLTVDGRDVESIDVMPSYFAIPHQIVDTGGQRLGLVTWMPNAMTEAARGNDENLAAAFNALGVGDRLRVFRELVKTSHSVHEISDQLGMSTAAVQRHIRSLVEAGLARRAGSESSGVYAKYVADNDAVAQFATDVGLLAARSVGASARP